MALPDPVVAARDWREGLLSKTEKIRRQVQATTKNPMALAAGAVDLWHQKVSSQMARDKFVANLSNKPADTWKNAMLGKGLRNLAAIGKAEEDKAAASFRPLYAYIAQVQGALPARGSLEQNIQRSVEMQRAMANYRRPA